MHLSTVERKMRLRESNRHYLKTNASGKKGKHASFYHKKEDEIEREYLNTEAFDGV